MNSSHPNEPRHIPSILSKARLYFGDSVLLAIIVMLATVSILVVYSSVAKMGYSPSYRASTGEYLTSHIKHIFLGFLALAASFAVGAGYLGEKTLYRGTIYVFGLSVGLMIWAYIFGDATNGAARWINLGFMNLQPSEVLKVAIVLFLAMQIDRRRADISSMRIFPSFFPWRWRRAEQVQIWREGTLPFVVPVVIACALILPAHTSSALLVFVISIAVLFVGRIKKLEIAKILLAAALAGGVFAALGMGRSETAGGRMGTWVSSWTRSTEAAEQVPVSKLSDTDRAMVAIYDGGVMGVGAGHSIMRAKITHPESDYIFALFVEEYGIVLAVFIMLLYVWVFVRAMKIFDLCQSTYLRIVIFGLAMLICLQALVHILVSTNLFPETGQNLPLISHGGTSMLCTATAFGLLLGISSRVNRENIISETLSDE